MRRLDHPAYRALLEKAAEEAGDSLPLTAEEVFAAEADAAPEAAARKQRSLAILRREGVPFNLHLPLIETEAEMVSRTAEAVALRVLALAVIAVKAMGDREPARALIEAYRIDPAFTPKERRFIDDSQPSREDCAQLSWRIEGAWVMLWALGFVAELEPPAHQVDPGDAFAIIRERGRDRFVAEARLRPAADLLDAADLIYRYHWAARDAEATGQAPPPGLDHGVIMERHHALNWLIGYGDADWDDVTTDT